MRLVIDLQGAQTSQSANRGVGRHAKSLTSAILSEAGKHEIIIALNGIFPETLDSIRSEFRDQLPLDRIRAWRSPVVLPLGEGPAAHYSWRTRAAQYVRESYLAGLHPDVVHVSSLFEGLMTNAVTSIGALHPELATSSMLFDLTPLVLPEIFRSNDLVREWYVEKLTHLRRANLWLVMSESTRSEAVNLLGLSPDRIANIRGGVDGAFFASHPSEDEVASIKGRYQLNSPFFLYYGGFELHKNLKKLLDAASLAYWRADTPFDLVLVGNISPETRTELVEYARTFGFPEQRVRFPGFVPDNELVDLLRVCAAFVYPSLREGFGLPVLEAMAAGAPVICSNATSLPEVIGLEAAMFEPADAASIAARMIAVLRDADLRSKLRAHGAARARDFTWRRSARLAIEAYEALHAEQLSKERPVISLASAREQGDDRLADHLGRQFLAGSASEADIWEFATTIAANRAEDKGRRLLVDVTYQSLGMPGSGIARVVDRIVTHLLADAPGDIAVEPVRGTKHSQFVHARRYVAKLLGDDSESIVEDQVELRIGDHFLALDLNQSLSIHRDFLDRIRELGGKRSAVVYDLLPMQRPDWFPPGLASAHQDWFSTLSTLDDLICISRTVAEDVRLELNRTVPHARHPKVTWFHLGSELPHKPSGTLPDALTQRPTILVVSILHARKGQLQALEAFEELWKANVEVNLVFVGRVGWGVAELVERIEKHSELGRRLFWFNGPDDKLLAKLYSTASGVLISSEGEGFGLPVVEALLNHRPVLARDLPVFHEIGGDAVSYYTAENGPELAKAVRAWLDDILAGAKRDRTKYSALSWAESTRLLLGCLGIAANSGSSEAVTVDH